MGAGARPAPNGTARPSPVLASRAWVAPCLTNHPRRFVVLRHPSRSVLVLLSVGLLLGTEALPAAAQGVADLGLTKIADRKNVRIGENITFTITVTNQGPDAATGVVFGDPLPDPLNLVSFTCGQGTVS